MSKWCRHVHVRLHCFILTEACSCRLELAYFAVKISKNRLVCKNAVAVAYYGSCRLLVMGSWHHSVPPEAFYSQKNNSCTPCVPMFFILLASCLHCFANFTLFVLCRGKLLTTTETTVSWTRKISWFLTWSPDPFRNPDPFSALTHGHLHWAWLKLEL